jgi:ATP-binding cassette subfamily B protein IrtA
VPTNSGDRAPSPLQGLRLMWPLARHGRRHFLTAAGLALAGTGCQLLLYWVVYRTLAAAVDGSLDDQQVRTDVVVAVLAVVGMAGLLGASTWMSHRAAFATLEHLRLRIGERLGSVPLGYLTRRRSGELQRVLNDDVERLESFLAHAIPDLISAAGILLGSTVWLLVVDWRMGLAALSVIVVAIPLMIHGANLGAEKTQAYGAAMARMNGSVVEFVRGLPVIRTFHRVDDLFTETAGAIRAATDFQADWGRQLVPVYTAFYTLLAGNVVVIAPVGLLLWQAGSLSTADLLFFLVVGLGYTSSLMKLMQLTTQLGRLGLGAALVTDLDRAPVLPAPDAPAVLGPPSIEVDDVRFAHTDLEGRSVPALNGVSFAARPGTMTAIVGPSGSGKSTLATLVCRFWDVDTGSIRVSGVDVRQMPFGQLMSQIAFVLQDTFLFDDTIAANLRLARPDATDAELETAARSARAHEFIAALPQGYDTPIGSRGARLSGGERQRLSIARALLKDAPIVVLDEATAYVDPENEAALQDALSGLVAGRTLLVVAHRLSTVVGADQILVLDGGRIVERGRHPELVAAEGLYARLWAAFNGTTIDAVVDLEPAALADAQIKDMQTKDFKTKDVQIKDVETSR